MNRLIAGIVAVPLLLPLSAVAQDAVPLETQKQRISYMIGLQMAAGMMQQGLDEDLDVDAFAQAMKDRFAGIEPRLSQEQMQQAVQAMRQQEMEEQAEKGAEAKATGEAFLTENKDKENVTTTDSGLQYRVTAEGSGEKPKASDEVTVHYEGRLLDGTVFDSSYERGEPAKFQVGQVIEGWQEALQLMPEGATWEVWIPSDLAYGPSGAGGAIGPNEVLNFTIELIEVQQGQ